MGLLAALSTPVAVVLLSVSYSASVGRSDQVVTRRAEFVELAPADPLVRLMLAWPSPTADEPAGDDSAAHVPVGVKGQLRASECIDRLSDCLWLTSEGETATEGRHVYYRRAEGDRLVELDVPDEPGSWLGSKPRIVVGPKGTVHILLALEHPWPSSPMASWRRAWQGRDDPLRAASNVLATLSPEEPAELRILGTGRGPVVSADRTKVAFIRSDQQSGRHSLHLWSVASDVVADVVSLQECDPGSGMSFHYDWSPDSRFLRVTGCKVIHPQIGSGRLLTQQPIVYDTVRKTLYLLPTIAGGQE